jgi:hypothetical protein
MDKADLDAQINGISLSLPQECWAWGDPKIMRFDPIWVVEGIEDLLGMAVEHCLSSLRVWASATQMGMGQNLN